MSRQPAWKRNALKEALNDLIDIQDDGYKVEQFTDYHWRIEGMDVWPSSKKYKKNGRVLKYEHLKDILPSKI